MKSHYTAKELAGLPGMPETVKGVIGQGKKGDISSRPIRKKNGSASKFLEYELTSLPLITQAHLAPAASTAVAVKRAPTLPAVVEPQELLPLAKLTKKQVTVLEARLWFVRLIEQNQDKEGVEETIKTIHQGILAGERQYCAMAAVANVRQGQGVDLSQRTIYRWWGKWLDSGKNPAALAPNDGDAKRVAREDALVSWLKGYVPGSRTGLLPGIPAWLPYFLDEYRQPQKPSVADGHRDMKRKMPAGMVHPSYDQVYRIWQKIPETLREKGRMTGAEYKQLLGYASRDASMDDPFTIGQIDGHSLKAYVAHPTTGAHFHPEVCAIICLTTKVLAGWSAGLAESNQTVADAYRHACTITDAKPFAGVFAIIEPDRGAGNLANVNADELTGRFARLGTTFLPPEQGGNPQGHGAIERSNQSVWIRAAKTLVTYTGKDMDRVSRKRVYTRLERDLKGIEKAGQLGKVEKTSELLMAWREFLAWLDDWAMEYNNSPHSALPKITCPATNRRRHMTPMEALAARISQGWQPVNYPDDLLPHLFMPHQQITVNRCKFTLHGNIYHAHELHHWHNKDMIAAYDIHDARHVWVLDMEERPVCQAIWNGNRVSAQPESVKDQAIRQREERLLKNLDNKARMIRDEAKSSLTYEVTPAMKARKEQLKAAQEIEVKPAPVAKVITLPLPEPEPVRQFSVPSDEREKYREWCKLEGLVNGGIELQEEEQRFFEGFKRTAIWKAFKSVGK